MPYSHYQLLGLTAVISGMAFFVLAGIANDYVERTYHWLYGYQYSYPYRGLAFLFVITGIALMSVGVSAREHI